MKCLSKLIIGFFLVNFAHAQTAISVEKIYKERVFTPQYGRQFNVLKDGEHFIQQTGTKLTKHKMTQPDSPGETLVDLDELLVEGKKIQVDDIQFSQDESKILLLTHRISRYRHSFSASYFVYDLTKKTLLPISPMHKRQSLATFSPDGISIAYVADNNLFVSKPETQQVLQITFDGEKNKIINGATDWVYEEEFALVKGFCWSPDSKFIAFLKFNESKVPEFGIEYNIGRLYPVVETYKYPKAGEQNSVVSAHVYSLENQESQQVISTEEPENGEYIPRLYFSPIDNTLLIQMMNRHQNQVDFLKITFQTAQQVINGTPTFELTFSEFFTEKNNTYVDIHDNLRFLKDGKSVLLTSERSGYNHIYRIGFDGTISQLTSGDWDVLDVYGIDEKNAFVYYSAAKKGAIYKGLYKTDIKTKKTLSISSEYGTNEADFTTGMHYFVKKYSDANTPPVYTLCDNKGKELSVLENNDKLKQIVGEHAFAQKKFLTFDLDGRSLNGWIIKPNDFDSTKRYPVYMSIYGGPGSNTVADTWDGSLAWHQLLAQNGYIVVSVDPRGTLNRGKQFKDMTYLQLGKYELEDFVAVANRLKSYEYIDSTRIGIQGWSYGGFMTSLAMTKGNGTFKMGIAVAPVTNWQYYDNIYTERFMRTPNENKSGYDDNSPINFADSLKGNYLLIHGSADDNVHFQNSIEMINALVRANKQVDFFMYPNRNHGIYGGNTRLHLYQMMLDYVKKNL